MVYEPQEDSFMLHEQVKKLARGKVLDIGTGSGIQAMTAAEKADVAIVFALDIDPEAIEYCKENAKNAKIRFFESDMFSCLKGSNMKFDTIIFNPPYLPLDPEYYDPALDGGKKGHEKLEKFLKEARQFLNEKGVILIVFSSLTDKEKVDSIIAREGYRAEQLSSQKIAFEELYCYKIENGQP
jgi:release factor glutamine methyltransferase